MEQARRARPGHAAARRALPDYPSPSGYFCFNRSRTVSVSAVPHESAAWPTAAGDHLRSLAMVPPAHRGSAAPCLRLSLVPRRLHREDQGAEHDGRLQPAERRAQAPAADDLMGYNQRRASEVPPGATPGVKGCPRGGRTHRRSRRSAMADASTMLDQCQLEGGTSSQRLAFGGQ